MENTIIQEPMLLSMPDCCFGKRWPVGLHAILEDGNFVYDICEMALPERFMIWELILQLGTPAGTWVDFCLRLGDHLPTTAAEFNAMELVFPGIIGTAGARGTIDASYTGTPNIRRLRMPMQSMGRRFVGSFQRNGGNSEGMQAIIVISSIPREFPSWLSSVIGKNL